ncbi:hypothetical protein [Micromonospora sp. NPDC049891]|uniref:hypothetical protein n=1 Tax=Micromonospora sp. NPDC049891 TaxID=3155655 RepID=UPI003407C1D9
MTDILSRIDSTIDGRCPCGADPRPGSPYCGPDCEPTHHAADTDTRESGHYATPMRWRPDLVTATDDTDLIPIGSQRCGYTGRHNAQIFERASDPTVWHLRLDDGHRYVGCDLTDMGGRQDPITLEQAARIHGTWQRLERELGNSRHLEPDSDPWADVIPTTNDWHRFPWTLRRRCARCGTRRPPLDGRRATLHPTPAMYAQTSELWATGDADIEHCQLCAGCRAPFPGPPLTLTVLASPTRLRLRVQIEAAGYRQARAHLQAAAESDVDRIVRALPSTVERLEVRMLGQIRALDAYRSRVIADIEGRIMDPRELFRASIT